MASAQCFSIDAAVAKLQLGMTRTGKIHNKKKVMAAIKDATFLSSLPLDAPSPLVKLQVAEEQVASDNFIINGVLMFPSGTMDSMRYLRDLCFNICRIAKSSSVDPSDVYHGLIVRMARNSAMEECFDILKTKLVSPDLLLMPRKERKNKIPPIEVTLFHSGGCVHASVTTTNIFGLFQRSDSNDNNSPQQKKPWIKVDVALEERINFSNGQNTRYIRVTLPMINTSKDVSRCEN